MAIQLDGTTGISTTGNIVADGSLTVGTFAPSSLSAPGNVTGANLNTSGQLSVGGNAIVAGDLTVTGNASLSGNIVGDKITNGTTSVEIQTPNGNANITIGGTSNVAVFSTTGAFITGVVSANGNITGGNINAAGLSLSSNVVSALNSTSDITTTANISGGNLSGTNIVGTLTTASQTNITSVGTLGSLSVSGNTTSGNLITSGVYNSAGNSSVFFQNNNTNSANVVVSQAGANGSIVIRIGESTVTPGTFGLFANGVIATTSNLTGANISTGGVVSASGNITGGNLNAAGLSLSSNVVSALNSTSNITTTANVQANYFVGTFAGNISGNITAPGSNTQVVFNNDGNAAASSAFTFNSTSNVVSVFGNVIGNNILANSVISATGNIISNTGLYVGAGATTSGLTNPIIVAEATGLAYVQVAARNTANTGSADMVTYADNGDDTRAWTDMGMAGSGFNDTAYTITNANDGYVFVQGNADGTGGNLVLATGNLGNAADIVFATGGFLDANEKMRFINATGQFWIETATNATSATSGALKVSGGAGIAGNAYVGGLISAAGNVTGGNLSGTSITGSVVSASGTITGGNLATGGTASAGGNITGANILTGGLISAAGNITGGNILGGANVNATSLTGTTVSVSGNITGGNISSVANITGGNVNTNKIVGTALTLISTGDLTLSTTGNINANNEYINNVPSPVQDGDAVNKLYVDGLVTTGFAFHQPVYAATNTTLASATGGTITYTQPNGAGNGIGATLTTTGSFNLIDTANIQTIGTRVLVKDEGNAVYNGVYTWANSTAIVRSTDTDEYGADSTQALSLNDYFFVQSGNVNAGSAYIVSAPAGTITFGTSNITFAQFSSSQVYTANTSAGISLNGTVINALVDNVTTAFSSGNIVVKTGAQLTTPNIGAATGTSLSTTGNVTGGNILTGGIVSATGNITGNYFFGNGSQLTGIDATSIQNGTSNVRVVSSGGNVAVSIGGTSNVAVYATTGEYVTGLISASGNITGGNLLTGGLISSTGNITSAANVAGANVISTGLVTATGNIVTTANVSGGNVLSSALIQGVTLSASGNVNGANITTAGLISATGNITGSNILTGGLVSATGNITSAANIAGGNAIITTLVQGTTLSATGNVNTVGIVGTGNISTTGNISGGNLLAAGLSLSSNVLSAINLTSTIITTANITGGNLSVGTGTITGGNIVNSNANGVGNIGSATVYFNTVFAKATSAQYADLAESYAADAEYSPGTVLTFGGTKEVTISTASSDARVAGVVSTNPAHVMNAGLDVEHVAVVALTGRVPTSVVGTVRKGDMMVSGGNGYAQACATPAMGTVIGKALEDFDGESGVIEIVVGRL